MRWQDPSVFAVVVLGALLVVPAMAAEDSSQDPGATFACGHDVEAPPEPGARGDHGAILINGTRPGMGFTLPGEGASGEPVYRPGSGVVRGSGTAEDPFVIEGWEVPRIDLRSTEAHVVVQANDIQVDRTEGDGVLLAPGIYVMDARNVTLRANVMDSPGVAQLALLETNPVERTGLTDTAAGGFAERILRGTGYYPPLAPALADPVKLRQIRDVPGLCFEDNVVDTPLVLSGLTEATLADNHLEKGPKLLDSPGIELVNNTGLATDVNLLDSPEARLVDNEIQHASLARSPSSLVEANQFGRFAIQHSSFTEVRDNVLDPVQGPLAGGIPGGMVTLPSPNGEPSDLRLTVENNTVQGEPLVYVHHREDITVTEPAGQVLLVRTNGIHVEDVNVTSVTAVRSSDTLIENVTVPPFDPRWGIKLYRAPHTTVQEPNVLGMYVAESRAVTIEDGRLGWPESGGYIRILDSPLAEVANTTVEGKGSGRTSIHIHDSPDALLSGNRVSHTKTAIAVEQSPNATVVDNRVTYISWIGIEVDGDTRSLAIENNEILHGGRSTHGITAFAGDGWEGYPRIANNTIHDLGEEGIRAHSGLLVDNELSQVHGDGMLLGGDPDDPPAVHRNNIDNTTDRGVAVLEGPVDASDNWWGCPDGPPSEDCADADENVTFRPWAEEPFPQAGAN